MDGQTVCNAFGVGVTIKDDEICVCFTMGEEPNTATHLVVMGHADFKTFIARVIGLDMEMHSIETELGDSRGELREAKLRMIQDRYHSGLN